MSSVAEKNVQDYLVDELSEEQFDNIMTFVKNMTVKDSYDYDDYLLKYHTENPETDLSRWFGDLLIKYYTSGLTADEISELMVFVNNYNEQINDQKDETIFKIKCWGMYKDQDFESSLLSIIVKAFKSYLIKSSDKTEELEDYLERESSAIKTIFNLSFPELLGKEEILNLPESVKNAKGVDNENSILNNAIEQFLDPFETNFENITNIKTVLVNKESIIIFKDTKYGSTDNGELPSDKDNINIYIYSNNNPKMKASEKEKVYTELGSHFNLFDIKIPINNLTAEAQSIAGNFALISTGTGDGTSSDFLQFAIVYKELNPEYRTLINANTVESIINLKQNEIRTIFSDSADSTTCMNETTANYIRRLQDIPFLLEDYKDIEYDDNGDIIEKISTSKIVKFQYSNPFIARHAVESDIISYFYGDDYISDLYGAYEYEREEIHTFLQIYAETKTYFYKVLLNESFTNEKYYKSYEKFFITSWAVERFLSCKLDSMKDINTYDRVDIKNFLESFGMPDLAKILDTRSFIESEVLSKRVLKSYIQLASNKGSRKIVDIVKEIFELPDSELEVYKGLLINTSTDDSTEYKVIKVPYGSTNIPASVDANYNSAVNLEGFVGDGDPYWNIENTPLNLLNVLGVNTNNTKYLIPEFSTEISERYTVFRCMLAIADYIWDKLEGATPTIIENYNTPVYENRNLAESIKDIRYIFMMYFKDAFPDFSLYDNIFGKVSSAYRSAYRINEEYLKELKDIYYKNDDEITDEMLKKKYYFREQSSDHDILHTFWESLTPLIIFENSSDIKADLNKFLKNESGAAIDVEKLWTIFYRLLEIPIGILSDLVNNSGIRQPIYDFIMDTFYNVFFSQSSNESDILYYEAETGYEPPSVEGLTPEEMINKINEILRAISSKINRTFYMSSIESQTGTLDFVISILEYFISYTSEIYKAKYINQYNTKNEMLQMGDDIRIHTNTIQVDSFYYDEDMRIDIHTDTTTIQRDSFYYDEDVSIKIEKNGGSND